MQKQYLGDGVYLNIDESELILTTENGISVTNTIYLDFEVLFNLYKILKDVFEAKKKEANKL